MRLHRKPTAAAPPQPQASAQAAPQAPPPQSATGPAAPVRGLGELDVSAPPSPEASNAAAAASADLKTLGEQIAANPPSGAASPPTAAKSGSDPSADMMAQSEYLGQTVDLYDGQSCYARARRFDPPTRSTGAPARGGGTVTGTNRARAAAHRESTA